MSEIIKNKNSFHLLEITTVYDERGWTEIDWSSPDFENLIESSFTEDNRNMALKQFGISPNLPVAPQLEKLLGKKFYASTFKARGDEYRVRPETIMSVEDFEAQSLANNKIPSKPLTLMKNIVSKKGKSTKELPVATKSSVPVGAKTKPSTFPSKDDFRAWGKIGAAKRLDKIALKGTADQLDKLIERERTLKNQCSENLFEVVTLLKDIIKETLVSY